MKTLLVLGASGEMGQRIVRLSHRLLPGVRVLEGSRQLPGENPTRRQVNIHDHESLKRALMDVDAVINSVGPFEYNPSSLVSSCLNAGCHYVDIAETADFLIAAERASFGRPSGIRQAIVLSGCSTIPGLVQVLAQKWANRDDVSRIRVLLSMGSANPTTPTLLFSLLHPLGSRAPDGSRYFDRLVRKTPVLASTRLYGRFPSSFDTTGLRLGGRVLPATLFAGLDRDILDLVLWVAAKVIPALSSRLLLRLCRLANPGMSLLRKLGTPVGVLAIEAIGEDGSLLDEIDVRADREGLDIPALPSVWAVRSLLSRADLTDESSSLIQLISPDDAASWLRHEGYSIHGV